MNYKNKDIIKKIKLLFLESEIYPQKQFKIQKLAKEIRLKERELFVLQKIISRKSQKKNVNETELKMLHENKIFIQKNILEIESEINSINILDYEKYKIFNKILSSISEIDKKIIEDYFFKRLTITNLSVIYQKNYRYIDKILTIFTEDILNLCYKKI